MTPTVREAGIAGRQTDMNWGVVSVTAPFNLPARFILMGTTAGRLFAANADRSAATKRAQWRTIWSM
jgi:hypothetical protein